MATSGRLGTSESRWADLLIGGAAVSENVQDASNTLAWTSEVEIDTFFETATNELVWVSLAETPLFVTLSASNAFVFQSVSGTNQDITIVQYLNWTPRTFVDANNDFSFVDEANDVYFETVDNVLGWEVEIAQAHHASNELVWVAAATARRVEDASNEFTFVDEVDSIDTEYGREGAHTVIRQHLTYSISGPACAEKDYTPFVGTSDDDSYDEIDETPPVITIGDTLTLTYPRVSPTTTVILKNPTFGNTESIAFTVIDRATRGGDRVIFSDPKWAKTEIRTMQIDNICSPAFDDLVDFINMSLGKEIGLLDWEGRDWKGIIIAPETEIVKGIGEVWRVQITFQGELV